MLPRGAPKTSALKEWRPSLDRRPADEQYIASLLSLRNRFVQPPSARAMDVVSASANLCLPCIAFIVLREANACGTE